MDFEAVGNSDVFRGTVLVGVGAISVCLGWFLFAICKPAYEWLKKWRWFQAGVVRVTVISSVICFLIVFGSWMVGKGGTKTTKGWNLLDHHEQRTILIGAVAQELYENANSLDNEPLKGQVCYEREDGELVQRPFPDLRTDALNGLVSSGLWAYGREVDKELLDTSYLHIKKIDSANRMFRMYNDEWADEKEDPNARVMRAKKWQASAPSHDYYKSLIRVQIQLIELILGEPKWDVQTRQPKVHNDLVQWVQRERKKSAGSKKEERLSKKKQ